MRIKIFKMKAKNIEENHHFTYPLFLNSFHRSDSIIKFFYHHQHNINVCILIPFTEIYVSITISDACNKQTGSKPT